jgi:Cft2 family RNA processing exonuclease
VLAQVVAFCRQAHADSAVPVLLAYSLGKAQEILHALLDAGLSPMLHDAVWKMTEVYRELRPDFPGHCVRLDAASASGKVIVCPPGTHRSPALEAIPKRVAVLTGWAIDRGARFRYRCDAAFPLTDHADYPDLLRYVELVRPRRVLTLHGFAAPFARDLRARGIEAWSLCGDDQLELNLGLPLPA